VRLPEGAALVRLVNAAVRARNTLVSPNTTIVRLVHDAPDGLPGLQVDRFGGLAVVQAYLDAWQPRLEQVGLALLACPGINTVRAVVRGEGGLAAGRDVWVGAPVSSEIAAQEGRAAFLIRPDDGSLNVGLFPDARLARERVMALSGGESVLNLFAYTGGFTVAALLGGAAAVDQVDVSAKVASWAARNVAVNGVSPRQCRFVVEDAVVFTAKAARQQRVYGLVVMDPPTFARNEAGWTTTRGLVDLVANALRVTRPGGRLLFSTNTRHQDAWDLWAQVEDASRTASRPVVLEDVIHAGPDFPRARNQTALDRFKMLQVRVGPAST